MWREREGEGREGGREKGRERGRKGEREGEREVGSNGGGGGSYKKEGKGAGIKYHEQKKHVSTSSGRQLQCYQSYLLGWDMCGR